MTDERERLWQKRKLERELAILKEQAESDALAKEMGVTPDENAPMPSGEDALRPAVDQPPPPPENVWEKIREAIERAMAALERVH
jgi:hypothetical protein